jgi:serine/threonine-protein kinase RsbW
MTGKSSLMLLTFTLNLPRDGSSVPFVRHLCRSTLERLGVEKSCIDDIEVAVSEACTNVYKHANRTDEAYEVEVSLDEDVCRIEVSDAGPPFDPNVASDGFPLAAETGRGISLMRALVDDLEFESLSEGGTVVTLNKTLSLHPASMLRTLAHARGGSSSLPGLRSDRARPAAEDGRSKP